MKKIFLLALMLTLAACGFQLRGVASMPFQSLYVDGGGSQMAGELAQALRYGSNVRKVDSSAEAEAVLQLMGEGREKRILTINAAGRVSEYVLFYRISFRLHDGKGKELMATQQLELKRDLPFSDTQVLAKEQEEALLFRDMQSDAVQQVIRRLSALKI